VYRITAQPAKTLLPEKTKSVWFTAITTHEQALKVIKGAGILFFVIAALLIPLGAFFIIAGWGLDFAVARSLEALLIGAVSAALALWLILGKSRVAFGLVILSFLLVVSGIIAIFVTKAGGGGGCVVAVIALFAAVKAVEATFKLRPL
jgi:hypothetical protein